MWPELGPALLVSSIALSYLLTGKIMKGAGYGVIGDIILGILGALIGGFIMRQVGFAGQGGLIYTILVALGGAVVLTAIVRAVKRV